MCELFANIGWNIEIIWELGEFLWNILRLSEEIRVHAQFFGILVNFWEIKKTIFREKKSTFFRICRF